MESTSTSPTHSRTPAAGVVVGVDNSPGARQALRWALDHARSTGLPLTAVHAYRSSVAWIDVDSRDEDAIRAADLQRARRLLADVIVDVMTDEDPEIEELVVPGPADRVLIEVAESAALLVVGSRGRGGFAGVLLGSVSHRCAHHSPCPLVIVPADLASHT